MPILDSNTLEFFSHSPEQTRRAGIRLGDLLKTGNIVCLEGDLGSGKTTLVQGIAQGWGSADPVSSPTYMIVNEYRHPGGGRLFHLDAYRLAGAMDAQILDFDRMLLRGCLVIEWPERIKDILPIERLWIQLRWTGVEQRHFLLVPFGKPYKQILQRMQQKLFGAT